MGGRVYASLSRLITLSIPQFDVDKEPGYSLAVPTVMRSGGFRFFFFLNEGLRAHIHVARGGGRAKVWLDDLSLASARSLTGADTRRILKLVLDHREELQDVWTSRFGRK